MVAEGALAPQFARIHPAFDDQFGIRRHLQVVADAAHHLHPLPAQEAGEHHLGDEGRQRRRGGVGERRVAAEADRHRHPLAGAVAAAGPGAVVVQLGVEAQGPLAVHLQAVEPHVALAVAEAGVAQAQGDEGAAVLGPGGEHRQPRQGGLVPAPHHLLAEGLPDRLRHPAGHLRQQRQLGQLVQEAGARLGQGLLDELVDPVRHRVQAPGLLVHPQGHGHAPGAAEDVHGHRHGRALDPFEQQRAAAAGELGHPVGDGPGFQAGVHLGGHPLELAGCLQLFQEGLEIPGHDTPRLPVSPQTPRRGASS